MSNYETNWVNTSDVVREHYGTRELDSQRFGTQVCSNDILQTVNYVFDYDNLPSAKQGDLEYVIPAYSTIMRAYLEVVKDFKGTDNASSSTDFLIVGLQQPDGTSIDDDGILKVGALTDIDSRGKVVTQDATGDSGGAPALINTSTGSNNGQVVVQVNDGSLTAGIGRLIIEYLPESVDNKTG